MPAGGTTVTTDANGQACLDGLVLSSFTLGDYTVTETVPDGYDASRLRRIVDVDTEATCERDPYVGETAASTTRRLPTASRSTRKWTAARARRSIA